MLTRAAKLSWRAEHQIQPCSAQTSQAGMAGQTPALQALAGQQKSAEAVPSDTLGKMPQGHCSHCHQQMGFSMKTNQQITEICPHVITTHQVNHDEIVCSRAAGSSRNTLSAGFGSVVVFVVVLLLFTSVRLALLLLGGWSQQFGKRHVFGV